LPIIPLAVRDEVCDRIVGLELGADVDVAKPFEPEQLLAGIRAVLRRAPAGPPPTVDTGGPRRRFEGLRLDGATRRPTTAGGAEAPSTSSEFELPAALLRGAGETASRARLIDIVYGDAAQVADRSVDAHAARLRRKLEAAGSRRDRVGSVRGQGFRLAGVVAAEGATSPLN
jgi:DNA-binding response OmpR family regulator